MANLELKKDRMCATALNLARDSIVIVDGTGRNVFLLWYLRQFGESACGAKILSKSISDIIVGQYPKLRVLTPIVKI